MKKKCFSILSLLSIAFFSHAQMFMYGANGETVAFQTTSKYVLEFDLKIDKAKANTYMKAIAKNAGVTINDGNYLVIPQTKLNTAYIKQLMGIDTLMAHLSPMVTTDGYSYQWSTRQFFVKVANDKQLKSLLTLNNIPYLNYQNIGSDPQLFLVTVKDFVDHTIEYANKMYSSGMVVWSQPAFNRILETCSSDFYSDQWGLNNSGQYNGITGIDINAEEAWLYSTGNGVKVAVLDDSIDVSHIDLANNILPGCDATQDILGNILDHSFYEYHGTMCAGVIAAEDNGIGVKGVAYEAGIIPVRISNLFGSGDGRILRGLYQAWNTYGADVLSCSWITPKYYLSINDEITRALTYGRNGKGSVVVFSAGNNNGAINNPANAVPGIIVVGAISPCGERKSPTSCDGQNWGSNFGSQLDVVAPGVFVSTTDLEGENGYNMLHRIDGPYNEDYTDVDYTNYFNGTSAACPFVSGVAALMLSVNPDLTAAQVEQIICETAQKLPGYTYTTSVAHPYGSWNVETGYGLVDAGAAVRKAWLMVNGDLCVKDDASDNGVEPNITATSYTSAPEITIQTGNQIVGNPTAGNTYQVHVVVNNYGSAPSVAGKKLRIYYSKQSGSMAWPNAWVSNPSQPNAVQFNSQRGLIGTLTLPAINVGGSYEAVLNWSIPTQTQTSPSTGYNNYFTYGISLLAVVEDGLPTIGLSQNNYSIDSLVFLNNNVARRNFTVRQYNNELPPIPITFNIAPNPTVSTATISYELPEGISQVTLTLVSLDGQVYKTLTIDANTATSGSIPLNVENIPTGKYQVVLSAGTYAESKTLIVY